MTDQADEIAREIVISASRKILLKGDEWITLALKENADVFAAEFAAALRSYADEKLEEAADAIEDKDSDGAWWWADIVRSLKSKEPQT